MINRENEFPIFCYFKHNMGKKVLHDQLWSPKLLRNKGGKGGMGRESIVKLHGFNYWVFSLMPAFLLLPGALLGMAFQNISNLIVVKLQGIALPLKEFICCIVIPNLLCLVPNCE